MNSAVFCACSHRPLHCSSPSQGLILQPVLPSAAFALPSSSATRSPKRMATYWSVPSGSQYCQISTDGLCVTDGAGRYGSRESCLIRAEVSMTLSISEFELESSASCSYDYLRVGATKYCGLTGPDGIVLDAGDTMQFRTDSAVSQEGFTICAASGTVAPAPPSPPPANSVNAADVGGFSVNAADVGGGAAAAAPIWTLTTNPNGDCEISPDGLCITDGTGNYANNDNCVITANIEIPLIVTEFDMEGGSCSFDYVKIGSQRYCGQNGPDGVTLAAGDTVEMHSDGSVSRAGFTICAPPPSPPPPSPAPDAPHPHPPPPPQPTTAILDLEPMPPPHPPYNPGQDHWIAPPHPPPYDGGSIDTGSQSQSANEEAGGYSFHRWSGPPRRARLGGRPVEVPRDAAAKVPGEAREARHARRRQEQADRHPHQERKGRRPAQDPWTQLGAIDDHCR